MKIKSIIIELVRKFKESFKQSYKKNTIDRIRSLDITVLQHSNRQSFSNYKLETPYKTLELFNKRITYANSTFSDLSNTELTNDYNGLVTVYYSDFINSELNNIEYDIKYLLNQFIIFLKEYNTLHNKVDKGAIENYVYTRFSSLKRSIELVVDQLEAIELDYKTKYKIRIWPKFQAYIILMILVVFNLNYY